MNDFEWHSHFSVPFVFVSGYTVKLVEFISFNSNGCIVDRNAKVSNEKRRIDAMRVREKQTSMKMEKNKNNSENDSFMFPTQEDTG